jgi:recombination DNA repair RAD52 pathway protein
MGFSAKQMQALRRSLTSRHVRTREANGRELSYIEGWFAISEANRIFGFDSWDRETVESRCVLARENRGTMNFGSGPKRHRCSAPSACTYVRANLLPMFP